MAKQPSSKGFPTLPTGEPMIIPARSARAFLVGAGQFLKVTDIDGHQDADFYCVNAHDLTEGLSCIVTTQRNFALYLTTGHRLFSSRRRPMFTIVEDTVGRHDLLMGACSRSSFEALGAYDHPNCQDLLRSVLEPLGVQSDYSDTFNIFMNVAVTADGRLRIELSRTRPGDYLVMRADTDALVGITACPADLFACTGGNPTPIGVEILKSEGSNRWR